ncbi:MAG: GAF domain-containing protein [Pirellulales bacterium]|nr:GAF domain-containing protein [Pirellulales bacterium]
MSAKVRLSEILEAMEPQSGESSAYLDKRSGKVVVFMDEELRAAEDDEPLDDYPDWQRENIKLAQEMLVDDDAFVGLPTEFDIHEYGIMERFCLSLEDGEVSDVLTRAIQGSGAFRRFKNGIQRYGIAETWYPFRDEALKRIAVEWCRSHEISYRDDVKPMLKSSGPPETAKAGLYHQLVLRLRGLLEGERDFTANAANTAGVISHGLAEVNWVGFYVLRGNELVLGPFQGRPACTRIPLGKGVCGSAAQSRQTVVVENVREFPGHIACDDASASEIVVPLIHDDRLIGVLDLDSPALGRFDDEDRQGLEKLVEVFLEATELRTQP